MGGGGGLIEVATNTRHVFFYMFEIFETIKKVMDVSINNKIWRKWMKEEEITPVNVIKK